MTLSVKSMFLVLCGVAVLSGCSLVDDDLRACDADYTLDYELSLVTDISTEINAALNLETDVEVATALKGYLDQVFTNRAHDVNLSFYDVEANMERLHHDRHVMDASQASYTLSIPVQKYMHVAVANLEKNPTLGLEGDDLFPTASLRQVIRDTIPSQSTGLFTACMPMDIKEGEDQVFEVNLAMANCSASVVLDTLGSKVRDIKVYASGFATGYSLSTGSYIYDYTPVMETHQIEVEHSQEVCFTTVSFPSRLPDTKADEPVWEFRIYATTVDGSITETRLGICEPLEAGHIRVVKGVMYPNGTLIPSDETIAISVQLDWKPGMEHEVIL